MSGLPTRSPGSSSPVPRSAASTPLVAKGLTKILRVARGVHRGGSGDRPGFACGDPRPERRGQDHAAAPAGRRRDARCRCAGTRARSQDRLFRPGARHARRRRHGVGEHPARRTRHRRAGSARSARCVHVQRSATRPAAGTLSGGEKTRLALAGSGGVHRQRAAARRADQQPRSRLARTGARRAAQLRRRGGVGDPRPGGGGSAGPAAGGAAARTAPRTIGRRITATSSSWPDQRQDLLHASAISHHPD